MHILPKTLAFCLLKYDYTINNFVCFFSLSLRHTYSFSDLKYCFELNVTYLTASITNYL